MPTRISTQCSRRNSRPASPPLERDEIRDWYNAYCWRGTKKLYNPVSILWMFQERECQNWWFETATPAFLVNILTTRLRPPFDLQGVIADNAGLSKFDVGDIGAKALLFQTGYLTITGETRRRDGIRYRLGYPNREVRQCLNGALLDAITTEPDDMDEDRAKRRRQLDELYELPEGGDTALVQIIEKNDADKYRDGRRIVLVGIEFDTKKRNLIALETAEA